MSSSPSTSCKSLGFEPLFEGPILLAKLLELRWLQHDEPPPPPQYTTTPHNNASPFLNDAVGAIIIQNDSDTDTDTDTTNDDTAIVVPIVASPVLSSTPNTTPKSKLRSRQPSSSKRTRTRTRTRRKSTRLERGGARSSMRRDTDGSSTTTSSDEETETELSSDDNNNNQKSRKQGQIQPQSSRSRRRPNPTIPRPLTKMPFLRRTLVYLQSPSIDHSIPPTSLRSSPSSPLDTKQSPPPSPLPIMCQSLPHHIHSSTTKQTIVASPTPIRRSGRKLCKRDTSDIDLQGIAAGESFTITETMDEGGGGGRHNFDLVGKLFYPRGIRPVGGLAAAAKAKMKAVRSARGGTKRKRSITKTTKKKNTIKLESTTKTTNNQIKTEEPDRQDFPNHTKSSILPPKLRRRTRERQRVTETKVFYHYLYRVDNATDSQGEGSGIGVQVEERLDRRCPFCFFNAVTDAGILKHCNSTHDCELTFEGGRDEKGDLHIAVKSNPLQRWSSSSLSTSKIQTTSKNENLINYRYISSKRRNAQTNKKCYASTSITNDQDDGIPFLKKPLHDTAFLDPVMRRRKIRALQAAVRGTNDDDNDSDNNNTNTNNNNNNKPSGRKSLSSLESAEMMRKIHAEAISQYVLTGKEPIRQYYHSRTNLPMADGEWEYDSDDDPIDDMWIHKLSEKLIDEFGDVSPKEKILMNLWNRFIRSHTVIADSTVPTKCMDFIIAHHKVLIMGQLRAQVLAHCMNLWDNRLLSSSHIYRLMKRYDKFVEGS